MISISLKLDSVILKEPIQVKVFLPQTLGGNDSVKNIWCLHPIFSDGDIFVDRLNLLDYVETGEYAVIAPCLSNSYYVNLSNRCVADFLDSELYPFLSSILNLPSNKSRNICLGVSMGAFGALSWGLRKPDFFSRLICISGYYDMSIPHSPELKKQRKSYLLAKFATPYMKEAFLDDSHNLKDDSQIADKIRNGVNKKGLRVDIACGDNDLLSLPQSEFIYSLLKQNGYDCSYAEVKGEHDIFAWRECIKLELSK